LNEIRKRTYYAQVLLPHFCTRFTSSAYASNPFRHTLGYRSSSLGPHPLSLVCVCVRRDRRSFWNVHHHYDYESRKGQMKKGCHFRWKMRIDHRRRRWLRRPKWARTPLKGYVGEPRTRKCCLGVPNGRGKTRKECTENNPARRHPLVTGQQKKKNSRREYTCNIHRNEMEKLFPYI
jgi:hypothetical protein